MQTDFHLITPVGVLCRTILSNKELAGDSPRERQYQQLCKYPMANPTRQTSLNERINDITVNLIQWLGFNVIMALLPFGFIFLLASMKEDSKLASFDGFYEIVSPHGELSIASIALLSDVAGDLFSSNYSHKKLYIIFQKVLGTAAVIILISLASIYGCVAAVDYFGFADIQIEPALNLLNHSFLTILLICLLGKLFVWMVK
jgi:hypothetical protein